MKHDEHGKELTFEKVADMYPGISLWKVDVERTREQDKNAQVMDKRQFERLQANMREDNRLESVPLGYIENNAAGMPEFKIISGHHRIRAARMAGITVIFVMVIEDISNPDEVVAKQLAHNALVGESDPQVLKELFNSIRDIDAKVRSGVMDVDLDRQKYRNVSLDEVAFDFDFRTVKILFLSSQLQKFQGVLDVLEKDDTVFLANNDEFPKFAETLRELSKLEDIRNISALLSRMCDITMMYVGDERVRIAQELKDGTGDKKKKAEKKAVRGEEA